MPYAFSGRSRQKMATLHHSLRRLAEEVMDLQLFDFGIDCGHRNREEQNRLVEEGKSKLPWPQSKHNRYPSQAMDIRLLIHNRTNWTDLKSWSMAIGVFRAVAKKLNIDIRVGADWDGDFSTKDQNFNDMPHIELIMKKE